MQILKTPLGEVGLKPLDGMQLLLSPITLFIYLTVLSNEANKVLPISLLGRYQQTHGRYDAVQKSETKYTAQITIEQIN